MPVQKRSTNDKTSWPKKSLFKCVVESGPSVLQCSYFLTVASHLDSRLSEFTTKERRVPLRVLSNRGPAWPCVLAIHHPREALSDGQARFIEQVGNEPASDCLIFRHVDVQKSKLATVRKLFLFLQKSFCFQKAPFLVPNSSGPLVILVQVIATNRGKGMEILAKFRCYLLSASHSIPIISKHHKLPLLLTKMS